MTMTITITTITTITVPTVVLVVMAVTERIMLSAHVKGISDKKTSLALTSYHSGLMTPPLPSLGQRDSAPPGCTEGNHRCRMPRDSGRRFRKVLETAAKGELTGLLPQTEAAYCPLALRGCWS